MATNNSRVQFSYVPAGKELPASRDANTIYFSEATKQIFVGTALIASDKDISNFKTATEIASDIQTALETALANDISVVVTGTGNNVTDAVYDAESKTLTITKGDVSIPDVPEYAVVKNATATTGYDATYEVQKDGAKTGVAIDIPGYTIEEITATSGSAKSYALKKNGTAIGDTINIPKDLMIQSGEVKEVTTAGQPYSGAAKGDKYIEITLNDAAADKIFIPVKDLVDVYTGGNGINVSATNEISADTDVLATKTYAEEQATAAIATWTVVS